MYIALAIAVIVLIWLFIQQPANKALRNAGLVLAALAFTGAVLYGVFVLMGAW